MPIEIANTEGIHPIVDPAVLVNRIKMVLYVLRCIVPFDLLDEVDAAIAALHESSPYFQAFSSACVYTGQIIANLHEQGLGDIPKPYQILCLLVVLALILQYRARPTPEEVAKIQEEQKAKDVVQEKEVEKVAA